MRGFGAFLRKELVEIFRTWQIWVLPGIVLFFALTGPPLAKLMPQLLSSLVGDQQTGLIIQVPTPTYLDAYLQWTKNLQQIVLFAVIIMFGGVISREKRSGTAALVLTKPLSRTAFVVAKFLSQAALLVGAVIAGGLLTWGMTYAIFGEAPFGSLAQATGAWLLLGLFFLALMELLSASMDSQAGAAGLGLGSYLLLSIGTLWAPTLHYTPAGLLSAPTGLVQGAAGDLLRPLLATAVLVLGLVAVTTQVFRRREL